MSARIIIISGPPGAGKTTLARLLSEDSAHEKAANIHLDDFWQYISKGYIEPWLSESGKQNKTVVEAAADSAERFYKGGYEVFVDGLIGPWFIEPWRRIAGKGTDVRYIILRPDEETTVMRATTRKQNDYFPLSVQIIKDLWDDMNNLGEFEPHVVNTSGQTIEESAAVIQKMMDGNNFRI